MKLGAATPVENENDIQNWYSRYRANEAELSNARKIISEYCRKNSGATSRIMEAMDL